MKKLWCRWFGHKYIGLVCKRCGLIQPSRAEVLAAVFSKYTDQEDQTPIRKDMDAPGMY